MIARMRSRLDRMASSSRIVPASCSASLPISSMPRPVRRDSVSAKMPRACSSVSRTAPLSSTRERGSAIS
jgi:hypothetical protein